MNTVIFALQLLFLEPNLDNPINQECASLVRNNRTYFERLVHDTLRGGFFFGDTWPPNLPLQHNQPFSEDKSKSKTKPKHGVSGMHKRERDQDGSDCPKRLRIHELERKEGYRSHFDSDTTRTPKREDLENHEPIQMGSATKRNISSPSPSHIRGSRPPPVPVPVPVPVTTGISLSQHSQNSSPFASLIFNGNELNEKENGGGGVTPSRSNPNPFASLTNLNSNDASLSGKTDVVTMKRSNSWSMDTDDDKHKDRDTDEERKKPNNHQGIQHIQKLAQGQGIPPNLKPFSSFPSFSSLSSPPLGFGIFSSDKETERKVDHSKPFVFEPFSRSFGSTTSSAPSLFSLSSLGSGSMPSFSIGTSSRSSCPSPSFTSTSSPISY